MAIPFSPEQFLDTFRRYNEGVWPAQVVLLLLALVALWLASGARQDAAARAVRDARVVLAVLASLWGWMGVVYHLAYFRAINPAATVFGVAFIAQGAFFAWLALRRMPPQFGATRDTRGIVGALLASYALVVYPLLGVALGHRYPYAPTFGLPCPTTLFTFALLCWARGMPRATYVVPLLWAVVGTSAALSLGMREDLGLLAAALVFGAAVGWRRPATAVA